ncbi:MAG: Gfo/Idh/MocA family oxidoreductase [Armatimonadota bacterium]|nr:Gfo/Idh/MocA family oxidoreductase [Armatimonadota bacterium]
MRPGADPVRVGVVGLGNWGRLHAETVAAIPGARLAAVCDLDPARRAATLDAVRAMDATARGAPPAAEYASFDACLRGAELDAVIVATRDEQHVEHAVAALERGWHVLVEKPLALDLAGARAVEAAARRARHVAMVGTILRFSVPHRQLADAVHAGRLGRVLHVRSVRYVTAEWIARTPVHTAIRLSVHDIDLALWLAGGRATRVAAVGHTLSGEGRPRSLIMLLWLDGGASAVVETHYLLPRSFPSNTLPPEPPGTRVGTLEVFGDAGVARLDDSSGLWLWNRDGAYSPDLFVTPRAGGRIVGALRAELEHFVACAASGEASMVAPLADSVHGIAVATAAMRAERHGTPEAVEAVDETPRTEDLL